MEEWQREIDWGGGGGGGGELSYGIGINGFF